MGHCRGFLRSRIFRRQIRPARLTRALAKELAPSNIQVNALACGVIDTEMNARLSTEERAALEEEIPAGRYGTPEEAARAVLMLAEAPAYLTGQIIGLDGGMI